MDPQWTTRVLLLSFYCGLLYACNTPFPYKTGDICKWDGPKFFIGYGHPHPICYCMDNVIEKCLIEWTLLKTEMHIQYESKTFAENNYRRKSVPKHNVSSKSQIQLGRVVSEIWLQLCHSKCVHVY
ncbi:hypothetical protein C0J52_02496 [Blattella germanica]|nr:hypothetical protein C0J52_02496 [Blattella germanica]